MYLLNEPRFYSGRWAATLSPFSTAQNAVTPRPEPALFALVPRFGVERLRHETKGCFNCINCKPKNGADGSSRPSLRA